MNSEAKSSRVEPPASMGKPRNHWQSTRTINNADVFAFFAAVILLLSSDSNPSSHELCIGCYDPSSSPR